MTKLRVLDLFSGIGGFSLGFEKTGKFETLAFCEIDKNCHKVLKKHWPEIPIYPDITILDGKLFKNKVDVICGGFPCQDVSVAGKQKGLVDENGKETRSGLWFQYKRIIEEIKPKYVVIENVKNLQSNGFATVLKDLHEIGYNAEWHVISARSIGSCHLRERLWIIAYPHSKPLRIEPEREEKRRNKIQQSEKTEPSNNGEKRNIESPNSNGEFRLGGEFKIKSNERREQTFSDSTSGTFKIADSYNFRLWRSFASEEDKQKWWAKTSFSFRDWWKVESSVCRVDDGLSGRLYENNRKERIKQLGNSIVPQIAQLIAEKLIEYEESMEKIECL